MAWMTRSQRQRIRHVSVFLVASGVGMIAMPAWSLDVGESRGAINTLIDGLDYFFPADRWTELTRGVNMPLLSVKIRVNCRYDNKWNPFESQKFKNEKKDIALQTNEGIRGVKNVLTKQDEAIAVARPLIADIRHWTLQSVKPLEKDFRFQIGAVLKTLADTSDTLSPAAMNQIAGRIDVVNARLDEAAAGISPLVPKIKAFESAVTNASEEARTSIIDMKNYALATLGGVRADVAQYPCGRDQPNEAIAAATKSVENGYARSLSRQDEIIRRVAGMANAANVTLVTFATVTEQLKSLKTTLLDASGRDAEGRKSATATAKAILVENKVALADDLFVNLIDGVEKTLSSKKRR